MTRRNNLGWKAQEESATIIGNGPSRQVLHDHPELVIGQVFLVGHAGLHWPGEADFWCCLHPDAIMRFYDRRREKGFPMCPIVTEGTAEGYEAYPFYQFNRARWRGGSSSLFAVELAQVMGFKRAHCFGIDLTEGYELYQAAWKQVTGIELIGYGSSLAFMKTWSGGYGRGILQERTDDVG